jgi:ubiquinone/menaquinone biosynthesis C-methylase UbiE
MNWHDRYTRQAAWTRQLRDYLFARSALPEARRVLEVGCGTGAVLADLNAARPELHGADIAFPSLLECRSRIPAALLSCADAHSLPYGDGSFDVVFCHFLLLWLSEPLHAIRELKRVTAPSGYVIAFAEPDYGARQDQPVELQWLGQRQNESLQKQGAALRRGAELADLFHRAGIRILETGPIRRENQPVTDEEWESEWSVLEEDLTGATSSEDLLRIKNVDRQARMQGGRLLHVPTYFAWGQV